MKFSTVAILGAGALFLFHIANLGVAGNVLQYYIQSIDFTGITTGRIILMVQNPSQANIILNSMAGTISANGTNLGNISNFQGGVQIPANDQTPIAINVAISLSGLISTLYGALVTPNGATPLNFVITGNANIDNGLIIPFNIVQTVTV